MNPDDIPSPQSLAHAVLQHAGALVLVLDRKGRICRFNRACEELSGFGEADVLGRLPWEILLPPDEPEAPWVEELDSLVTRPPEAPTSYVSHWLTRDGRRRTLEWSNTVVPDSEGRAAYVVCVGSDITERLALESQLRRYGQIVDQIHDSVISTDLDGIVTSFNRGSERIFGYRAEEVVGAPVDVLYPEAGRRALREEIIPTLVDRGSYDTEVDLARKDGRLFRAHLVLSMLRDEGGRDVGMIGYTMDVSERFRATEELAASERRLRELNESLEARIAERSRELREVHRAARFGTWTWDFPTGVLEWDDQVFALFGYPPSYTEPSFDWFFERVHEEDRERVTAHIDVAIEGEPYDVEFRVVQRDGGIRWALAKGEVIRDEAGAALGMRGTCIDIHARKVAEESLRASLHQKEVLLKEVHHRVKNNLAMVNAFLQLQQQSSTDAPAIAALRACEHRVHAMASVHKLLYQSPDFDSTPAQTLFEDLTSALRPGDIPSEVEIDISAKNIHLAMDVAIPCAMIVNELLSNALQHGFEEGQRGTVEVRLEPAAEGGLRLSVSDDGRGLPEGSRDLSRGSLGLQLVDVFARQLRADVRVTTHPTKFEFVFRP